MVLPGFRSAPFLAGVLLSFALAVPLVPIHAKGAAPAGIRGFVTDQATGVALEMANVALTRDGKVVRGTVTNKDGLYRLAAVEPGAYVLYVTYVGYDAVADSLTLESGRTLTRNIELRPLSQDLDEIVIQSERAGGAARVTAGQQTIRPLDIELIPSPDLSADLATYLKAQPGVVATGDRGGQLFIRGGEPSQNLVTIDGMTLYQPFHILGFYSAFPAEMLSKADIYAGGYGSRFGQRLSSVLDIWTREGSKRTFAGSASVSSFIASGHVEGPILKDRVSLLASFRQSTLEQGVQRVVDQDLNFRFGDAFARLQADLSRTSRLSVTAISTHDRGQVAEQFDSSASPEVRWANQGLGGRLLILPRSASLTAELRLSYSRLKTELGPQEMPTRSSTVSDGQLALEATFLSERWDVNAGWAVHLIGSTTDLGGLYQNTESRGADAGHFALYLDPEYKIGNLRIRPGARLEFYPIRTDPLVEPRLRVVWDAGKHQFSGAGGVYHQMLVGLSDQRDAASVFTAWTNIPSGRDRRNNVLADRVPQAIHALAGYRYSPSESVEWSLEGYRKWLSNLFVPEWSSFPRMSTRLQPADGTSYGFDSRLELRLQPIYAYLNYGYSNTTYRTEQANLVFWFGDSQVEYRPPHDRHHQINAVVSADLGKFDASLRWEFGSGLPFSRPLGFDGFLMVDDPDLGPSEEVTRRVIYERPYNAELPTYHRLDMSLEYTLALKRFELTLLGSIINVYDRSNIFYVDLYTLQRSDQLPFVPSFGIKVAVN